MRVKLLKSILENGGVKIVRRGRRADGTYELDVPFVKGAEIEMSDLSGQKYIDRGEAAAVVHVDTIEELPK